MQLDKGRCRRADQGGELAVEAGAVSVDVEHPAAEGVHGQLGGVDDRVCVGVGTESGGGPAERVGSDVTEPFPQVIGGAEAEMAELVETLRARVTPGAISHHQHPDRLDIAVSGLGHRRGAAAEGRSSCLDGVDAVGLAVSAAGLTIRAADLNHRHPGRAQEAGQASPIGAGAFHPDPRQRAERGEPGVQLGETGRRGRERLDAEHAAIGVNCGGDVSVEVSVYPPVIARVSTMMVIAIPSSVQGG